jgi:signal transduction histidine kinase
VRWVYWATGLIGVLIYHGRLDKSTALVLALYLWLNVALIPLTPRANSVVLRRYLGLSIYVVDLLFASILIHYTGGYLSQLFLLYCLLPFKAAIYSPYVRRIIFVPLLIFPLYIVTLWLGSGTLVFIRDEEFISRYFLLLPIVLAGMYMSGHLNRRHQQTRELLEQLQVKHSQVDARRRELRAVLDSIIDGVLVVDPEMRLLMINPVAADVFGLPYPQWPDKPLDELLDHPPLLNLVRRALHDARGKDALVSQEIKAHPASSDKNIVCHALATALVGEQDSTLGAVVALHDMTRQKELDEAKSNFISVLSHELRTPLTTIRGYIELILAGGAGDVTPGQQGFLKTALDRAQDLDDIIQALLDFAQLESGEAQLELGDFSLQKLVYKILGRIEPLADQQAIDLQAQISPDLEPLYADSQQLEQVLIHLLDNALKFTAAEGKVMVSACQQNSDALICVSDTGIGIPPAERERIFERFYQVDNSSTRAHGGTGLGLAICKHIVEAHQGRIWVQDNDEGGSIFSFTIPRELKSKTRMAHN